jgi:hypothetical protein
VSFPLTSSHFLFSGYSGFEKKLENVSIKLMENLPKFEIIGAVSEEEKEKARKRKTEVFLKQEDSELATEKERREIKQAEYPKTPEQIAILRFINDETNRLMQECGVEPFDIPLKNWHILPEKELKKIFDSRTGVYVGEASAIGLSSDLRLNLLRFAVVAFHEALHMKSREIWELYKDKDDKVKEQRYRGGVRATSPHTKDKNERPVSHFCGLDEGIVAWQEKLSFPKLLEIPELAEEKKRRESEENIKARQKIAKDKERPEDEIFWIDPMDDKNWSGVGYIPQREVLDYVLNQILEEFGNEYKTKDDLFKIFLKTNFDGNLIPIARLMKQTFGGNGLRVLGMMKTDNDNGGINNVLEMLRKMRRDILSKK